MTYILLTLLGVFIGWFLGRYKRVSVNDLDAVRWSSQQLMLAYFITNEMYRTRVIKWMKSQQALDYASVVLGTMTGKLFLLPVEDKGRMETIITHLNQEVEEDG